MQGEPVFDSAPFEHIKTDYETGVVGGPGDAPSEDRFLAIEMPPITPEMAIEGRCPACARPWDDHKGWMLSAPNLKPLCS